MGVGAQRRVLGPQLNRDLGSVAIARHTYNVADADAGDANIG